MADLMHGAAQVIRAADVLLRVGGGPAVMLRMPGPASAGDTTEQLGLAMPEFQDIALAPVVFRKSRQAETAEAAGTKTARWELMVSATAVNALMGSMGFSVAGAVFAAAFGVLIDGVLMEIVSATESEAFGQAYVYGWF